MRNSYRIVITSACLIGIALLLGILSGRFVGQKLNEHKDLENTKRQVRMTRLALSDMQTIEIGDTLPDFVFENLERKQVRLSGIIGSSIIVSIVQPECESCIDEIDYLAREVKDTAVLKRVVFISSGNPRLLEELARSTGIASLFLYDHRGAWISQFDINVYPFSIQVDDHLVIKNVFAGLLTRFDLQMAFELVRPQ